MIGGREGSSPIRWLELHVGRTTARRTETGRVRLLGLFVFRLHWSGHFEKTSVKVGALLCGFGLSSAEFG
jgi:hypothetical protein